jgi:hypothetical protein
MRVRIILEMVGCCLHLLENFLYAQQATDWFIQKWEKVQELHYLLSRSPNKDSVESHCSKLLLVQLSFGNHNLTYLFGVLHWYSLSWESNNITSLLSIKTIYSDILGLKHDSI